MAVHEASHAEVQRPLRALMRNAADLERGRRFFVATKMH